MLRKLNVSVARLALAFIKLSVRLKSTKTSPSSPLGSRILSNPDDIFKHNMWDHVQWTEEDKENARRKAEENSAVQLPLTEQGKYDTGASQYWDQFYGLHQDKFFKDRRWLFLEFPELLPSWGKDQATNTCHDHQRAADPVQTRSRTDTDMGPHRPKDPVQNHSKMDSLYLQEAGQEQNEAATHTTSFPGHHASFKILEVGCGVGNSVFPIVNNIKGTNSFLYCCDFSQKAIELVKAHQDYDDSMCHAFVHDICEEVASFPFPPRSLDVILAVFVFSSIHPGRLHNLPVQPLCSQSLFEYLYKTKALRIQGVVSRLSAYLKPEGIFLFRDYGRYDFSQLRFKKGRCLSENFYTRGDGTCVYFFSKEEVHDLFSKAGLEEIQNLEDKRLQVNRGKKVVMHRVWMQSKYRKPYGS